MRLTELRFFVGVNLYSDKSVCRLSLEGDGSGLPIDTPLSSILLQRSLQFFPGLQQILDNRCQEEIKSAHAGHLVLGLIELAAYELGWQLLCKNLLLPGSENSSLYLIFSYEDKNAARLTVNYVLKILKHLNTKDSAQLESLQSSLLNEYLAFSQKVPQFCSHNGIRYRIAAAKRLGIPAHLADKETVIYGHGRFQQRMIKNTVASTSWGAVNTATNKLLANHELHRVGLPVPRQRVINSRESVSRD